MNLIGVWFFRSYARINLGKLMDLNLLQLIMQCKVLFLWSYIENLWPVVWQFLIVVWNLFCEVILSFFYYELSLIKPLLLQFTEKLKIWTTTQYVYMFLLIPFEGLKIVMTQTILVVNLGYQFFSFTEVCLNFWTVLGLTLSYFHTFQCRFNFGFMVFNTRVNLGLPMLI